MKMGLLPKSTVGKWAVGMAAAFVILMILKYLFPLPLPSPLIAVFGVSGFVASVTALVKRDRAVFVFLAFLLGLIILIWISAELIYPH